MRERLPLYRSAQVRAMDQHAIDAHGVSAATLMERAGEAAWAQRLSRAVGGAPVEARPDSSRYLDVTVLLGASWRPPAEAFNP